MRLEETYEKYEEEGKERARYLWKAREDQLEGGGHS
jgi:hypothetical protein